MDAVDALVIAMSKHPRIHKALLAGVYTAGILGILATGDGGNNGQVGPFCSLSVRGIAPLVDGSGSAWVGVLAKTDSSSVNRVVLIDDNGTEQASYFIGSGGIDNSIRVVAQSTDGTEAIYVGGDFTSGILRLNSNGTLDTTFIVGGGFNGRVTSILPLTSGKVYVGGYFTRYKNIGVNGLVRLSNIGTLENIAFPAAGVTNVESLALATGLPAGTVYSGGSGAKPLERWTGTGQPDPGFNPVVNPNPVLSVLSASDGGAYVGGSFTNGIVRLNVGGSVNSGFAVGNGFNGAVSTMESGVAGDIYAGGSFTAYKQDTSENGIVRLNSNGSRDTNFETGIGFSNADNSATGVATIAQIEDGSADVIVGGNFVEYNGSPINGIVRLTTAGSINPSFEVDMTVDGEPCNNDTMPDLILN